MIRAALILALAVGLASGCTVVDTSELAPLDGYTDWYSIETGGAIPGHGDTVRVIYVNDTARGYPHTGEYPIGSVIVKEVRESDDGNPGDLNYLAIMRRLDEAPSGGTIEGGWLFTRASALGGDEVQGFTCWNKCHVQAPYPGVWLDYGM